MIYLDHSATTPPDPAIFPLMERMGMDFSGNPSSVHAAGRRARAELERCRAEIAGLLGAGPEQLIFTASGSEANTLLIHGAVAERGNRPSHLVVSAIEHDSVLNAARRLAARQPGVSLTEVPPDSAGRVSPEAIAAALRPETALVCLMHANNETGRLQPVAETARIVHAAGARLHVDAVQSFGRLPGVTLDELGCDSIAIAGHKFYGPKGIGALALRGGIKIEPIVFGGEQERGRRAGTENLPAAAGMALAARIAAPRRADDAAHARRLEGEFLGELRAFSLPLEINGDPDDKLPGVLNLSIEGCHQDDLIVGMDLAGFAISAGSACSSGVVEPSHVLRAMGLPPWRVEGGIRISFGRANSPDEARAAAHALALLCQRLLKEIPAREHA